MSDENSRSKVIKFPVERICPAVQDLSEEGQWHDDHFIMKGPKQDDFEFLLTTEEAIESVIEVAVIQAKELAKLKKRVEQLESIIQQTKDSQL